MAIAGRHGGARQLHAARVARAAGSGGDPLRGRAAGRNGAPGRPVRARRERGRRADARRSARRCGARSSSEVGALLRRGRPRRAHALHEAERSADGGCDGPRRRRTGRDRYDVGGQRRRRPLHRDDHAEPGRAAARGQVPRVRLVGQTIRAGRPRPSHRGARPGASHRLGGAGRGAAQLSRRLLGTRGRRARRRRRPPAGRALRALPHPAGRRSRRAAGDRGEGSHWSRLRRPHVLGHRAIRPARAHLHQSGSRRRRASLASLDARSRAPARGRAGPPRRRLPVAHNPRRGVLELLARRHRRLPRRGRHRRRRRPLPSSDGGCGLRVRGRRRAPGGDRPFLVVARPP